MWLLIEMKNLFYGMYLPTHWRWQLLILWPMGCLMLRLSVMLCIIVSMCPKVPPSHATLLHNTPLRIDREYQLNYIVRMLRCNILDQVILYFSDASFESGYRRHRKKILTSNNFCKCSRNEKCKWFLKIHKFHCLQSCLVTIVVLNQQPMCQPILTCCIIS